MTEATAERPQTAGAAVPDHVPRDLVQTFDFRSGLGDRPHEAVAQLHDGPRIFYSPVTHQDRGNAGGAWILTKAEDMRTVLQNPEVFSSGAPRSKAMGESWKLIPLEIDPPDHAKYRMLLNPVFAPKRLALMDEKIRTWAGELIDKFADKGECEFVADFAEPFPIGIFVDLMGLPREEIPMLRNWAVTIMHDREQRGPTMQTLKNYLLELIADRRRAPREDLMTQVVTGEIEGRPVEEEEALGMCFLLFIAGLDTVVSSSTFHFRHLAEHPEDQAQLREDRSRIPDAVEELFRAYPVVTTSRVATRDTDLAGVHIREGDTVTVSTLLSTRDPDEFPNPERVDLARSPNRHNAFSYGPHRCLGSHLARREIIIAVDEWMRRLPPFRVQPGARIEALGGGVIGLDQLPLRWPA